VSPGLHSVPGSPTTRSWSPGLTDALAHARLGVRGWPSDVVNLSWLRTRAQWVQSKEDRRAGRNRRGLFICCQWLQSSQTAVAPRASQCACKKPRALLRKFERLRRKHMRFCRSSDVVRPFALISTSKARCSRGPVPSRHCPSSPARVVQAERGITPQKKKKKKNLYTGASPKSMATSQLKV
jgi:hypothetical protein